MFVCFFHCFLLLIDAYLYSVYDNKIIIIDAASQILNDLFNKPNCLFALLTMLFIWLLNSKRASIVTPRSFTSSECLRLTASSLYKKLYSLWLLVEPRWSTEHLLGLNDISQLSDQLIVCWRSFLGDETLQASTQYQTVLCRQQRASRTAVERQVNRLWRSRTILDPIRFPEAHH